MVVGYGTVIIKLFGITSLKEKRSIVKRLTNELKKGLKYLQSNVENKIPKIM